MATTSDILYLLPIWWNVISRLACVLPLVFAVLIPREIYKAVKVLAESGTYDVIPHGHSFFYGLKIYATLVRAIHPWKSYKKDAF